MRGFKPPWCLLCEEKSLLRHSTRVLATPPSHAASLGAMTMHSFLLTKPRKIEWSSLYIPWYEPFNSFWCFWVKIRDHRDDGGWEERKGGKYCDTYPLLKPTGSLFFPHFLTLLCSAFVVSAHSLAMALGSGFYHSATRTQT